MKPTTASMAATVLLTCPRTGPDEKTSAAPGVRAGGVLGDAPVRDVR
ncbi:hypothetical protein ACW9HR_02985 [Nocardia gipuzkoensis]|nr:MULTISPECIES: hypothetical protein [Nocardia]MBF6220193.1 hypothetical protein [Nocardia abscessus]